MRRNAAFGLLLYVVYWILEYRHINILEALVLLSVLVFVPLLLMLVDERLRGGKVIPLARYIGYLYLPAAVCAMLAVLTDLYGLAWGWFAYTGLVALFGLRRLGERGWHPLPEASIDIGIIYLLVGGFWFMAATTSMPVLNFSQVMIFLTAIHFHYSSLVIPIIVGLLGRAPLKYRRLYNVVAVFIILSPIGIALGITFSRLIEFIAVFCYFLALYAYGWLVFTAPFRSKTAKLLVSISAAVLLVTITFSLIYAYGRVQATMTIPLNQMIWIHGLVNAVGVVLPALVGWMIERPKPACAYYGKPMSRIAGGTVIGSAFLDRRHLIDSGSYTGLVDDMADYEGEHFKIRQLSPVIRHFYEHTEEYTLQAHIQWAGWFRPLARMYERISRWVQQIHLGTAAGWQRMDGKIVAVDSSQDGRSRVRAWVRSNERKEGIFTALYSSHSYAGVTYMNIALPLPGMNMTGILKPCNSGRALILSSARGSDPGDEGIYLHAPWFTVRLPLIETFLIQEKTPRALTAHHVMWIAGLKFLHIDYMIDRLEE